MEEKHSNNQLNTNRDINFIGSGVQMPMLSMLERVGNMFAIGPYYYYLTDNEKAQLLYVSDGLENVLGLKPIDFNLDLLNDLIHPDDVLTLDKKIALTEDFYQNVIPKSELIYYKTSYILRLQHSNGQYKTILHQNKILNPVDSLNKAKMIHIHTDISYLGARQKHKVSFIGEDRPNYYYQLEDGEYQSSIETEYKFTSREIDILKLIAYGKKTETIAEQLFISVFTVNTHKRNMLKKTKSKNMAQLIADCVRQGII